MKSHQLVLSHGAAIAVAALLSTAASAQTAVVGEGVNTATPPTHSTATVAGSKFNHQTTQAFINRAAYANRAEIAEARYVQEQTKSQAIKDFASQMINDHGTALNELEQTAASNGFPMPSGVDQKDRAEMNKLKQDAGARLDEAYLNDQEAGHKDVIATFTQAAQNQDIAPTVREYAAKTLPTLERHLHMARQLVATQSKGGRAAG